MHRHEATSALCNHSYYLWCNFRRYVVLSTPCMVENSTVIESTLLHLFIQSVQLLHSVAVLVLERLSPRCAPALHPFTCSSQRGGATVTTLCSSVHPSLNPRGVITWQCQPDFTWEGDWSGCTFPEGVGHAVAPLAYRVAAGASEVNNSIQTIVSDVSYTTDSLYLW